MNNSTYMATPALAQRNPGQSAGWTAFARNATKRFVTAVQHTLMLVGLAVVGAFGLVLAKPDLADKLKGLSPFAVNQAIPGSVGPFVSAVAATPDAASIQPAAPTEAALPVTKETRTAPHARQRERVSKWLSKRYRVASSATDMLVSAAYLTAQDMHLDPLLILSVMAIESRFNPFAESPVGAQGLMQVMSSVHQEKFVDHGGVSAALDPIANIRVGSKILKEYLRRGGSVEAGLKLYVGAGPFPTDFGYGAKVLAEYQRLKDVAAGKDVSTYATDAPKPQPKEAKADADGTEPPTTGNAAGSADQQLAAL